MSTFVFLDDSGSSGQEQINKFVNPNKKIWTGVILTLKEKQDIEGRIEKIINNLNKEMNIKELHFTEIYSGKGEFKGINSELRLEIFAQFVDIYNEYQPYVASIAMDENTLYNSGYKNISKRIEGFSLDKPIDSSLFYLLIFISEYIKIKPDLYQLPVEMIIDEGRQKAKTRQNFSMISDIVKNINYESSQETICLQFADFLAFTLNRVQNNFAKNMSKFDVKFMEYVGQIKWNTNLELITVNGIDTLNTETFEINMNDIIDKRISSTEIGHYSDILLDGYKFIFDNFFNKKTNQLDFDKILNMKKDSKSKEFFLNHFKELKSIDKNIISPELYCLIDAFEKIIMDEVM